MEQWGIPILSAVVVVEWVAIWWLRRHDGEPAPGRIADLDFLFVIVAIGLFISSLQYLDGTDFAEAARVAINAVRLALLGIGAYILFDQWRHDRVDS